MKERKNLYASIVGWGMFLAGAFAFSSCADEELDNVSQSTGKSIGFSTSYSKSVWEPDETRAVQKKNNYRCESTDGEFSIDVSVEDGIRSSITEQVQSRGTQITEKGDWQYKVGAYYTTDPDATEQAARTVDFFSENTNGGLSFASNATNATTNYYWPPVGTMKFFAVAPTDVVNAEGSTFAIPTVENINTPTLTYTIPSEVAAQKDIMVAQSTVTCNGNNGPVDLKFEHLLAAVQFKMGDMIATQVNSITISGIKGGEVTFRYSDGKWTPTSYGNTTSYALTLGTQDLEGNWEAGKLANTLNLDDAADITGNNNNSMLLLAPQTLSGAKVTVNYTELLVLDNGQPTTNEKTINLPEHIWEAGKTYAYTLNIKSGLNIEIPSPNDQDAHYVMVKMAYDLTGVSDDITELTASVEYINNTSTSTIVPSLLMEGNLTDLQKAGYWTETQYTEVQNSDNTVSLTNPKGIRGNETLPIGDNNKSGTLVMFLPENNGTTDREVVLRITGKYNDETLTIGSGSFKQYCPCWSNDGSVGVERFEERDKNNAIKEHPWGFKYTRTVKYKYESLISVFLPWIFEQQFSYEGTYYNVETKDLSFLYRNWTITINYSLLNDIEGANTPNGLENTIDLFNHVGNQGGIGELENFCITYKNFWGAGFTQISETGGTEIPEDFAAYESLKRNRFTEILRESENESKIFPTIFEEDIQWYLPSTTEAISLNETQLNSDGIIVSEIDDLDGTYWSSNKHVAQAEGETDNTTQAFAIEFSNGTYSEATPSDRMTKLKIRAVRKKP